MEHKYAGFWVRFAARFVDGIILAVGIIFINLILDTALGRGNLLAPLIDIIVGFGYFCYMTKEYGATYGKKLFGIKVIADHDKHLTWGVVVMREIVGKIVSGIILDIGYIMVAFTKRKQGLHDKIADTLVVYHGHKHFPKTSLIAINTLIIVLMATVCIMSMAIASRLSVSRASVNVSVQRSY